MCGIEQPAPLQGAIIFGTATQGDARGASLPWAGLPAAFQAGSTARFDFSDEPECNTDWPVFNT